MAKNKEPPPPKEWRTDIEIDALVAEHLKRFRKRRKRSNIESDVELALTLFEGFVTLDRKQLPEQQFLKADDETEARDALARLLRSDEPLDRLLRLLLAGHFDGRACAYSATRGPGSSLPQELLPRRRLTFTSARGQRREDQKQLKLGSEILRLLDEDRTLTVTEAVTRTAEKYKFSSERVWGAWTNMKKRGWKAPQ
jgi:hypothetical protein